MLPIGWIKSGASYQLCLSHTERATGARGTEYGGKAGKMDKEGEDEKKLGKLGKDFLRAWYLGRDVKPKGLGRRLPVRGKRIYGTPELGSLWLKQSEQGEGVRSSGSRSQAPCRCWSQVECYPQWSGDLFRGLDRRQSDPGAQHSREGEMMGTRPRVGQKNGNSFP